MPWRLHYADLMTTCFSVVEAWRDGHWRVHLHREEQVRGLQSGVAE
jgi:hypothetical protein